MGSWPRVGYGHVAEMVGVRVRWERAQVLQCSRIRRCRGCRGPKRAQVAVRDTCLYFGKGGLYYLYAHFERLRAAGWRQTFRCFQALNFDCYLAIR
jgi:hypothetical protein